MEAQSSLGSHINTTGMYFLTALLALLTRNDKVPANLGGRYSKRSVEDVLDVFA